MSEKKVLIIDNFDSFTWNLVHLTASCLPAANSVTVLRNNAVPERALAEASHLIISPGPCGPEESGISPHVVKAYTGRKPILGVCLGHQVIATVFGGIVEPSGAPIQGKATRISHSEEGLFSGIPSPLTVGRYHSLIVNEASVSAPLKIEARSEEGHIMALSHECGTTWGVQFHPESFLSERGKLLLGNFLSL